MLGIMPGALSRAPKRPNFAIVTYSAWPHVTPIGKKLIFNTDTSHIEPNIPRIIQEPLQQAISPSVLVLSEPITLQPSTAGLGLIPNIIYRSDSA